MKMLFAVVLSATLCFSISSRADESVDVSATTSLLVQQNLLKVEQQIQTQLRDDIKKSLQLMLGDNVVKAEMVLVNLSSSQASNAEVE